MKHTFDSIKRAKKLQMANDDWNGLVVARNQL
ncbi:Uncharacterised protein [Vibrio cholerae]|nr:Uncharacterised protein [Vibrio cholerae]